MPLKNNRPFPCSISCLFLSFSVLFSLCFALFLLLSSSHTPDPHVPSISLPTHSIKVYVSELPRTLNYGLLEKYWSSSPDSRIPNDPDHESGSTLLPQNLKYPPYPGNPLIKQYSAEYWILGDLMTPENLRSGSFAKRVFDPMEADVVFVPFFATLSAEMQLGKDRRAFRKKIGNEDYERQREVVDFVMNTKAWKRSGGRDHVFVLTEPAHMHLIDYGTDTIWKKKHAKKFDSL